MAYERCLCAILSVVFLISTGVQARSLDEVRKPVLMDQLIREAKSSFKLNIDQSKIQTYNSGKDGRGDEIVSVPLANVINTTREEIEKGDVYVSLQCMKTEQLSGCFKVRLTSMDKDEATFALVDQAGETVGAAETVANTVSRARFGIVIIRVWIDGEYAGCIIIIFFRRIRW